MAEDDKPTTIAVSSGNISRALKGVATLEGVGNLRADAFILKAKTETVGESLKAPPADHPIYAKIGKVASDWSHVEHLLDLTISELAATDHKIIACITAQMTGVYPRCKAILAFLNFLQQSKQIEMKSLIGTTTDIMNKSNGPGDKRNRIVHDPWYVYTGSGKTAQFKSMPHKDYRYGIQDVDYNELEQTLKEIQDFTERVTALKNAVSEKLKAFF